MPFGIGEVQVADWGIAVGFAIIIIGYMMIIIRGLRQDVKDRDDIIGSKDKEIKALNKLVYRKQEERLHETRVMISEYHETIGTIKHFIRHIKNGGREDVPPEALD